MNPYDQQNRQQQPGYTPKTAINELDSFLSGLTDEDRNNILSSPDFAPMYGEFLNKFLFWLLQGELGAVYVSSNPSRQETAEMLKLRAHGLYAAVKVDTKNELVKLQQQNAELMNRLAALEGK